MSAIPGIYCVYVVLHTQSYRKSEYRYTVCFQTLYPLLSVYSIHHYVIKFVSDLLQVDGLFRFPPPIKLTAMKYCWKWRKHRIFIYSPIPGIYCVYLVLHTQPCSKSKYRYTVKLLNRRWATITHSLNLHNNIS
jgi:hypothetical protein